MQTSRTVCDDNDGEQFKISHPAAGVISEMAFGGPDCHGYKRINTHYKLRELTRSIEPPISDFVGSKLKEQAPLKQGTETSSLAKTGISRRKVTTM